MKKVILVLVCLVLLATMVAAARPFWKAYSTMNDTPIYSAPCGELVGTVHFTREKVAPGFFGCGSPTYPVFVQRADGTWFAADEVVVYP